MATLSALLAFLPELLKLGLEVMRAWRRYGAAKTKGDIDAAFSQLKQAKSRSEKRAALDALYANWNRDL